MPRNPPAGPPPLDPAVQAAVVDFLRRWLPAPARLAYREMIAADPGGWWRHPHFAGGVVVRAALRGNGLDERALGCPDLELVWPGLLRLAVEGED